MSTPHELLAADIGGTNSRFQLWHAGADSCRKDNSVRTHKLAFHASYKNHGTDSLGEVLERFLKEAEEELGERPRPAAACLAVAGPVVDNSCNMTNISDWPVIRGDDFEKRFGIPTVKLLNDFVANAYGLLTLEDDECRTLQKGSGKTFDGGPVACLGAGTGLGEVYMTCPSEIGLINGQGRYEAWGSEGGHVEYAPRDELEAELLAFLRKEFDGGRISVERVVSGKGLVNIYKFLRSRFPDEVVEQYDREIMEEADEAAKKISMTSYDYPLAKRAIGMMLPAYGAEAGNVGLKFLPTGGLFVAGGITPKYVDQMTGPDSPFMAAFKDKGRVSSALRSIPVKAVLSEDIGIRGAHVVAARILNDSLRRGEESGKSSKKGGEEGVEEDKRGEAGSAVAAAGGTSTLTTVGGRMGTTLVATALGVVVGAMIVKNKL